MRNNFRKYALLLTLLILGYFLFSYKLTDVPPGINGDEASIGYNAILVSENLKDENLRFLPFFILTLNGSDYKQPVTFYITAILFKIFGPSFYLLRLVSIFFALLGLGLLFYLAWEIMGQKEAVAASLIYLTTPIVFIQTHLALENIAVIPFVCLWLLGLARFEKSGNKKYLLLSAMSLSIGIFSYFGMRMIVPIYFLISIYFICLLNLSRLKILGNLKFFLICFIPLILAIFLLREIYPGAILGNAQKEVYFNFEKYLLPFLSTYDLSFLFFYGDKILVHSTNKAGMFLLSSLPLFVVGLIYSLKSKEKLIFVIILSFFLSPALFGLVDSIYRASRLLVLVPLYALICAYGVSKFKSEFKKGIYLTIIIFMSINFYNFTHDYWNDYPGRVKELFADNLHSAFQKLSEKSNESKLKPLVASGIYEKDKAASKFFEKVYFKEKLETMTINQNIPDTGVILANDYDFETFTKLGYKQIILGIPKYVLYIKN